MKRKPLPRKLPREVVRWLAGDPLILPASEEARIQKLWADRNKVLRGKK